MNRKAANYSEVREVVLVEKKRNRAEWRKEKVVRHVHGSDGVVRREVLLSKLNPLRAKWPMEPALISGFCTVKRMRVFDSPLTGS